MTTQNLQTRSKNATQLNIVIEGSNIGMPPRQFQNSRQRRPQTSKQSRSNFYAGFQTGHQIQSFHQPLMDSENAGGAQKPLHNNYKRNSLVSASQHGITVSDPEGVSQLSSGISGLGAPSGYGGPATTHMTVKSRQSMNKKNMRYYQDKPGEGRGMPSVIHEKK